MVVKLCKNREDRIGEKMDENKLRALLTAVQCGSITKAAAQLDYTQSGMTHMMNKLETELGCRLLERTSHGVKLTVQGEHLMPYVHNVLRACDVLRREADECSNLQGQCLRVGCFPSIARSWLPDVLQRFRKMHPEVRVDVLVRGNELVEALEDEKIQVALIDDHCARGFEWTPLLRVPLLAVVPLDYPWEEKTVPLEHLLEGTFISGAEQDIEPYLPPAAPHLKIDAADDATILSMIIGGMGVSVLSSLSLIGFEDRVRGIPLREPIECELGVAVRSSRTASAPVRAFINFLM